MRTCDYCKQEAKYYCEDCTFVCEEHVKTKNPYNCQVETVAKALEYGEIRATDLQA